MNYHPMVAFDTRERPTEKQVWDAIESGVANVAGETLRAFFFDQRPKKGDPCGDVGGYSTRDVYPDVHEVTEDEKHWTRISEVCKEVTAALGAGWFDFEEFGWPEIYIRSPWILALKYDHDGIMAILVDDEKALLHQDLKNDYEWEWIHKRPVKRWLTDDAE